MSQTHANHQARMFGTDGVRGLANQTLTAELALALAGGAADVLVDLERGVSRRPRAIVGRDPRASGEFLSAAVCAGLAAAGVDVIRVGVLPTPAVAYLTGQYDADLGVMISASHNPMPDNGIKFFARGGHKLDDNLEDRIEAATRARLESAATPRPAGQHPIGADVGRISLAGADATERYLAHLAESARPQGDSTGQPLKGITVVVDSANGAASTLATRLYRDLGARVIAIFESPDGLNINDGCGSTHLDPIAAAVREHGADLGLALDGDADRCLAVDASGAVVDGDQIMAILAVAMKEAGTLTGNTLVATVMSNLGLRHAMAANGIELTSTAVGDRYVLEELRASGHALGGEQSGHVVLPAFSTTGDGTLTGLQLLLRMARTGRPLAQLAEVMTVFPQTMINVPVADKAAVAADAAVGAAVDAATAELGDSGRVLLRPSGTEALVRVMVEAPTEAVARGIAERIAAVVATR